MGFLLLLTIVFQIVSGVLLALHYTSDINHSYYSVQYFDREVYYGWCLHYMHSSGASFVFGLLKASIMNVFSDDDRFLERYLKKLPIKNIEI